MMTEPEVAGARLSLREYAYVIRRFWGFILPYRTKFYLGILMVLLSVPIGQFVLFLTRDVTNRALVPSDLPVDERWRIVVQIALLQAGLFLLSSLLWVFREVLEWYVAMRATFDIRLAYYRHLLRLPLAFLRQRPPGEHLYRATTDMGTPFVDGYDPGVAGMIVRQGPLLLETVYSLGWGAVFLYLIDPILGWTVILYVVPYFIVATWMYSKIRHTQFRFRHRTEQESAVLRDSVAGLRTVKFAGKTTRQRRNFVAAAIRTRRENIRLLFQQTLADQGALWALRFGLNCTVYILITFRVLSGRASIGDWLATFALVTAAQAPLEKFVQIIQKIRVDMVPAQRILETLDVEPEFEDKPDAVVLADVQGRVEFENVSLEYIPGKKSLDGVSFCIEPGQHVAFVGPSGAGKSSMLSLILRLYLPSDGAVRIDGVDTRDLKLESLLIRSGLIPQSTYLYEGTVADNIRFGNVRATDVQVMDAATASGLDAFLAAQPDGLDTVVGEGATISGGEKQRIGIARALVRNPRLFLLDEATANLDPVTERDILAVVERIRHGRTVLTVAHRLKAVVGCDQIVVLDQGRVEGIGTHDELIKDCALYRVLWEQQASGAGTSEVLYGD